MVNQDDSPERATQSNSTQKSQDELDSDEQMEIAEKVMRENHEVLRKLADS